MAIKLNDTITYGDLKTNILNWIKSIPKNVGSYASNVPASLKDSSWTKTLTSKNYDWEYRYDYDSNGQALKADRYRTHIDLTATINSSTIIPIVTATQIEKDFNSFLVTTGITGSRLNGIVTTSGLLNFWDNVICFLYRHLVTVASNDNPSGVLMYWSNSTYNYKHVTILSDEYTNIPSETKITAQDILDMLTTLKETYNFAQRTHIVTYSITKNTTVTKVATGVVPRGQKADSYCPERWIESEQKWDLYTPGDTPVDPEDYKVGDVIFESSAAGTYNIYIAKTGKYEVHCVGGGGGFYCTFKTIKSGVGFSHMSLIKYLYTGYGGGSGAYFKGEINITKGSFSMVVGGGGVGHKTGGTPTAGGTSKIGNMVSCSGGGVKTSGSSGGAGGTVTLSVTPVSTEKKLSGNSGSYTANTPSPTATGGKSVYNNTATGYGAGGGYNSYNGIAGYIKIIYKGT